MDEGCEYGPLALKLHVNDSVVLKGDNKRVLTASLVGALACSPLLLIWAPLIFS